MAANIKMSLFWLIFAMLLWIISGDFNVIILHTNDAHSRIEQTNKYSSNCSQDDANENKCYGGVARRKTVIDEVRRNHDNVILVDSGDQFQGSVWFSYYKGLEASHFMNKLGYDAMVLGNHEFDNGVDGLINPFLRNATFPVLACNMDASKEPDLNSLIMPYTILNVSGEQIGIVGMITKKTAFLTAAAGIRNIKFNDIIPAAQSVVDTLIDEGVNKIIGLAHVGFSESKEIAQRVSGMDILIDGHSNTFLYNGEPPDRETPVGPYPVVVDKDDGGQTLVYQAYAYGKYLGMANVTFNNNGEVTQWEGGNPILLDGEKEQDPEIREEVMQWKNPLLNFTQTIVGETYVILELSCRIKECNIGNMVTDAALNTHLRGPTNDSWSDVAIALWNGGGIRATLPKGKITHADVLSVLPFRNEIVKVWIKGQTLRAMFEHSVTDWNPDDAGGRFLQMSGVKVTYNLKKPEGSRVHDVLVRCTACDTPRYGPLDDDDTYIVLISAFLVGGGDGYDMLRDGIIREDYIGTTIADATREYMSKRSPLIQGEEGRISFYEEDPPIPCPTTAGATQHQMLLLALSLFQFIAVGILNVT